MADNQKVIDLFKRYGFEHRKTFSGSGFETFTYKSGFFYNAELVGMECWEKINDSEKNRSIENLKLSGFTAKFKSYTSLEKIEQTLFAGFFGIDDWKVKIAREYEQHCVRCLASFPEGDLKYKFIQGIHSKNGEIQDIGIVEQVCASLEEQKPRLIIIEAPAGFGKTCSSYEIVREIAAKDQGQSIPFFAEFSRDRQARIFSHILMREVDQSFSSVNSDVVIQEIKNGRIVVVLDGFDELLQDDKSDRAADNQFDSAEPMLETISELLSGKAKVILTSRRSAIFDGEAFNEWVAKYNDAFSVDRYRLNTPTITQWLDWKRLEALQNIGFELQDLANPVLLGYLRFATDEHFSEIIKSPDELVETYFRSMMDREMDRQDLRITPEKQSVILTAIASDMCQQNYVSESKEYIVDLIQKTSSVELTEARALYPPSSRPTVERLATTLSNHAFLDRCDDSDDVKFVNEFVFGNFVANCVLSTPDWVAHDERFVEPAVLSFIARTDEKKNQLWNSLQTMADFVTKSDRAKFEFMLTKRLSGNTYSEEDIRSVKFSDSALFSPANVSNTVFSECTFRNIEFENNSFSNLTFINCEFWGCSAADDNNNTVEDLHFFNCRCDNAFTSMEAEQLDEINASEGLDTVSEIERYILSSFFDIGGESAIRRHIFIGKLVKTDEYTKKELAKSIRMLKKRGFLETAHDHNFVGMNKDRIGTIKDLLNHEG